MLHTIHPLDLTLAGLGCPPHPQGEGARVEGSRGLCGSPRCPSSPWWWPTNVDHMEQEDTAGSSFFLLPCSTQLQLMCPVLLLTTLGPMVDRSALLPCSFINLRNHQVNLFTIDYFDFRSQSGDSKLFLLTESWYQMTPSLAQILLGICEPSLHQRLFEWSR